MSVFFATTEAERNEIYSLRYRVFIEEMGKYHVDHDHHNKLIMDEIDPYSSLLYTKDGEHISGTVRGTIINEKLLDWLTAKYDLPGSFINAVDIRSLSSSDRFVVDKNARSKLIGLKLMKAIYDWSRKDHDTRYCFITSGEDMLKGYYKFGFRAYRSFYLPNKEKRYNLVLLLCDYEFLGSIGSPFVRGISRLQQTDHGSIEIARKYLKITDNISDL